MTGKVGRRNLLRRTIETALAGAMTIKVASGASETEDEKLQVKAPDRIVAGKPFSLQINVAKVNCKTDETRWIEVWMGREYLGRFEMTSETQNATFTLTLKLNQPATLRVRDFYGRTVVKRLYVVNA
ncbi:MAG: hypothetical protein ACUVRR_07690 [Candidatus Fervidibacter sp.]|uniref:hypothetical protein n=1 Tax=Candidatus Fervidibacter sp. TaxID=3100871 RepID=UPI00404B4007